MKKILLNPKRTKNLILLFLLFATTNLFAADFRTIASGDWNTAANWQGGSIPTGSSNNADIFINHNMNLNGSINFSNGANITVASNVILYVNGSLDFKNKPTITIGSGAKMIILGNLVLNNGLNANIIGDLIVMGDFLTQNNTDVNIVGTGNMVVTGEFSVNSGNFSGAGSLYIFDPTPNCPFGDCQGGIANYYTQPYELQTFNPDIYSIVNGSLPIQLGYFTSAIKGKNIVLHWETQSEQNLDYFAIERSSDAKNYSTIETVKGSGWSQVAIKYSFIDEKPLPGINYYRLKAVDFDGYTEYFQPISVYNSDIQVVIVNTIKNKNLKIHSNVNGSFQLISVSGGEAYKGQVNNGINEIQLPFSLSKGVYTVIVYANQDIVKREKVLME